MSDGASTDLSGLADYQRWKPEVQQRALELLEQYNQRKWRPFYCPDPRCNGMPHEDDPAWDFNHARQDQRPPAWNQDWLTWLISSGRGAGKALDVDTPVPTPTGWTTMGELGDGDRVLGSDGRPCTVVRAHEPYVATAYRVLFSDGTHLDADADHQWSMSSRADRRAGRGRRVVTTAQIADSLTVAGERNWRAPTAAPLDLPPADLPIDPWVLGHWLGDGTSVRADVTIADDDYAEVEALYLDRGLPLSLVARKAGARCATYKIDRRACASDATTGRRIANGSMHSRLRAEGLLGNKHVPLRYLRASRVQREMLLAGLIDSDGYVSNRGYVEITLSREVLAEGVAALAKTLGHRVTVKKSPSTLNGVPVGLRWRISWTARSGGGLLSRKHLDRQGLGQPDRLTTRMVESVTEVGPRLVRCITVDSGDSCYLAGEDLLVTHNTYTGSNVINRATQRVGVIGLLGATGPDLRETMVEGLSGILATAKPGEKPEWNPSRKRLTWPNGCIAQGFSGEEPDRIRGSNTGLWWVDEPAHIDLIDDCWKQIKLTLRAPGDRPHIIATTTPKPTKWMKKLIAHPKTITYRVSTYANIMNLNDAFKETILEDFEGTRFGRQELYGEVLEDVEGSLWKAGMFVQIDEARVPTLERIVVAVDPAGSANARSDETGIIVLGIADKRVYVLADRTGKYSPSGWAKTALDAAEDFRADAIVAEKNYGGDMVKNTIEKEADGYALPPRVVLVNSRKGKQLRAEPVVAMYEKGRVVHVSGKDRNDLLELEEEQTQWVPGVGSSPNRVDALVHGVTEVAKAAMPASIASPSSLLRGQRAPTNSHLRAVN